jgi:hypothetical protein
MAKYSLPTFLSQAMSSKFVHLRHHGVQRNPGRAMMDEDRVAVIRNNLATRALLVHDLSDALRSLQLRRRWALRRSNGSRMTCWRLARWRTEASRPPRTGTALLPGACHGPPHC